MGASIFACWWAWPSPVQAPALQYHYARPLQRRGLACTMWSTMDNWVCIWYVSGLSLVCRSVDQTTNSAPASGLSLVCQGGPPLVCQWSVSGLSVVCQFPGLSNDLIADGYNYGEWGWDLYCQEDGHCPGPSAGAGWCKASAYRRLPTSRTDANMQARDFWTAILNATAHELQLL